MNIRTLTCAHGRLVRCPQTLATSSGPLQCSAPIIVTDDGVQHAHRYSPGERLQSTVGKVPAWYDPAMVKADYDSRAPRKPMTAADVVAQASALARQVVAARQAGR